MWNKKKERRQKNQNTPQPVQWAAKERLERVSEHTRHSPDQNEKPIKGMDIDKMNYTDI